MAKSTIPVRLPWEDRWSEPALAQLLTPLKDPHRGLIESLIEQVTGLDDVRQTLRWYGPAWKWTIEFVLTDAKGNPQDTLAYVVPNPEGPLVSVPLRDPIVDQLPLRRLNKVVRDGIRSAKRAVELHWAIWTPSSASDIEHLFDLIKRKHKLIRAGKTGGAQGNGHGE